MAHIHPTAIIEKGAELASNVEIGAYAYVSAHAKIGSGTILQHHASIEGHTEVGENNMFFPYTMIGSKTQDLKYCGDTTYTKIGNHNCFREFSTVHSGTFEGNTTTVGDYNNFLSYTHIAHECQVGSHIIMSNNATLAGHVVMGDYVVVGGLSAVHQFCKIGSYSMIGGCCKLVKDLPPYMIGDGNPAVVRTINKIGLERNGFTVEQIRMVRNLFKIVYREGLNHSQAIERMKALDYSADPIVVSLVEFLENSERGIA